MLRPQRSRLARREFNVPLGLADNAGGWSSKRGERVDGGGYSRGDLERHGGATFALDEENVDTRGREKGKVK